MLMYVPIVYGCLPEINVFVFVRASLTCSLYFGLSFSFVTYVSRLFTNVRITYSNLLVH